MDKLKFLYFLWISLHILDPCHCLRNVTLEGPRHVRKGGTLKLVCKYDTESESLYAIKWYRGREEFYRYLPKEVPPQQVFPVQGIQIQLNLSDEHNVILQNASTATNGRYKCVASAEGSFQTMFDVKNISVVEITTWPPTLQLEKSSYAPGEIAKANCTLEKTQPAANISWYINDKMVDPRHVLTRTTEDDLGLFTTTSKLIFNVSSSYSPVTLKCKGQLYDIYSEASVIKIQPRSQTNNYSVPDLLKNDNNSFLRGAGASLRKDLLLVLLLPQVMLHLVSEITYLKT